MATADDKARTTPGNEADDLPYLPPAGTRPGPPTPPAEPVIEPVIEPAIDPVIDPVIEPASEPGPGAPTLPPRPEGAPVAARLGPPANAPVAEPDHALFDDSATGAKRTPDPEAIAALRTRAQRIRRRNRTVGTLIGLVLAAGLAVAGYLALNAYGSDQDERRPPSTESPDLVELIEELDRSD